MNRRATSSNTTDERRCEVDENGWQLSSHSWAYSIDIHSATQARTQPQQKGGYMAQCGKFTQYNYVTCNMIDSSLALAQSRLQKFHLRLAKKGVCFPPPTPPPRVGPSHIIQPHITLWPLEGLEIQPKIRGLVWAQFLEHLVESTCRTCQQTGTAR